MPSVDLLGSRISTRGMCRVLTLLVDHADLMHGLRVGGVSLGGLDIEAQREIGVAFRPCLGRLRAEVAQPASHCALSTATDNETATRLVHKVGLVDTAIPSSAGRATSA